MKNATELWMKHRSVASWNDAAAWDDYLRAVQRLLVDRLSKLDSNDPARREADALHGEGSFVTQFGSKDDSRWVLGKFERTKIQIQVNHYKNGRDSFGRRRDNNIAFYVPEKLHSEEGVTKLVELFRMTSERWKVFYGYADLKGVCCLKKASSPSLGALNIASELPGVFWLTYFGPHYSTFIGRERLNALEQSSEGPAGGTILRLAETPKEVPEGLRRMMERRLGVEMFAGTGEVTIEKPEGRYALTLDQLSSGSSDSRPRLER